MSGRSLQRLCRLGAVPLLAIALASASCVGILGIRDIPPNDPSYSQCAGVVYAAEACARCVDDACCDEAAACAADGVCARDMACRSRCAAWDASCRLECGDAPFTNDPAKALEACRRTRCATACLGCGSYGDPKGAACSTAIGSDCCPQATACAADTACDRAAACAFHCANPTCRFECTAIDRASYDVLAALGQCAATEPSCSIGTDWSCIGAYSIPQPVASMARYTVELSQFGGSALEGIEVRACADLSCSPPAAVAMTDDAGVAALDLPLNPLEGFYGFTGLLDIEDPMGRVVPHLQAVDRLFTDRVDQLQLFTSADVSWLASQAGRSFGDSAIAFVIPGDCNVTMAPGVSLSLKSPFEAVPIYYVHDVGGLPSVAMDQTDKSGAAYAAVTPEDGPIPSEHVGFDMRLHDSQALVGSGWVPLRAGTVSRGFGQATSR